MALACLGIVFLVIILLLSFRRPLYQAILGGLLTTALLYRIPPAALFQQTAHVFTDWGSLSVLVSLYLITYLQQMLEARHQIKLAQQDLNNLFHSRRINAAGASLFIGLLPSAAAMILCGDIVKDTTEGYLSPKEQAFVTSWFRHIPESALPTYASVLLMSNLSGVPLGSFISGMLIPVSVLGLLGYFPYLHRLPKGSGTPETAERCKNVLHLLQHLWTLLAILGLILIFKLSAVSAILVVILAAIIVYHFQFRELLAIFRNAFDVNLLLNTFLVLVLKEFIEYTGVLNELPAALAVLPIPAYLIFALFFFIGGAISGTNGIIALGTSSAFAAIDGGMPLMVLLMCMCHAASQVSPTHICLVVASDYFNISLGALIRKTLPAALAFGLLMIGYYNLLRLL